MYFFCCRREFGSVWFAFRNLFTDAGASAGRPLSVDEFLLGQQKFLRNALLGAQLHVCEPLLLDENHTGRVENSRAVSGLEAGAPPIDLDLTIEPALADATVHPASFFFLFLPFSLLFIGMYFLVSSFNWLLPYFHTITFL